MKKIFNKTILITAGFLLTPMISYAQVQNELDKGFTTLGGLVDSFRTNIVAAIATLLLTMALAAFFWGVVQYIWGVRDGKPEKIGAGNQFMLWGLIAMFVMFSVWGIIRYAQRIFGIEGQVEIIIPQVRFGTSGSAPSQPSQQVSGSLPTSGSQTGTITTSSCSGKPEGSSCTLSSGGTGSCSTNEETGAFACHAIPVTYSGSCTSIGQSCNIGPNPGVCTLNSTTKVVSCVQSQ